jgi:hypothetical protein
LLPHALPDLPLGHIDTTTLFVTYLQHALPPKSAELKLFSSRFSLKKPATINFYRRLSSSNDLLLLVPSMGDGERQGVIGQLASGKLPARRSGMSIRSRTA